jgi:hypothetical protein
MMRIWQLIDNICFRYLRYWAAPAILFLLSATWASGADQAAQNAIKVQHILETIGRQQAATGPTDHNATITEKEFNDYIAYRLAKERHPNIDSLTIKLLNDNHIDGRIRFNAKRLNLDVLLGDNLDFDFSGIVYTQNRQGRLNLIALKLNDQPVNPQILDFVIGTAALANGMEPYGLGDWFALPKGLKNISTTKAKAILSY